MFGCGRDFREFRGILGAVLGIQLSKACSKLLPTSHSVCQSIRGPEGQQKKKNLGREQVRVKKGLRGQRKRPLPRETGPKGPCDPQPNTNKREMDPERPCPNGRGRCLSLGPHSGEGQARWPGGTPRSMTGPPLLVCEKTAAKHNDTGKKKNKAREAQKTLAASRPKKKASEGPRRIPKTHGVQNGTPKNAKKRDARPKRAKTNAAGHKNRKGKSKTSACGGVPCDYLSCLSQKKKKKDDDVDETTKGRQKKNQKHQT